MVGGQCIFAWAMTLCLIGFAVTKARALQPPAVGEVERLQQQGVWDKHLSQAKALGNDKMAPELVQRAASKVFRARLESYGLTKSEVDAVSPLPPPASRGLPTTGTPKMLTVLIAFPDQLPPANPTVANIALNTYGVGSAEAQGSFAPLESLNRYYFRASEGLLNIGGNVLPWYTMPNNRSTYTPADDRPDPAVIFTMLKAALQANDAAQDFSQYDNDGDGDIDMINIIWTGPKGAWASFWWGYKSTFLGVPGVSTTLFDGKTASDFTWEWLDFRGAGNADYNPHVLIHETGHSLGLPDYYDYVAGVGPDGGVGGLDMMDANQGNHNAFSRWMLDWISPKIVGSGTPTLETLNASGNTSLVGNKAVVVFPNAASNPFGEFFVVENRQRVGNDAVNGAITGYPYQLPSDGLMIWHVDGTLDSGGNDFIYDNSLTSHKLLRLMEADGQEDIEAGLSGDAGDYYNAGQWFNSATTPNSFAYDTTDTSVSVGDISADGNVMTAKIGFLYAATVAQPYFVPPAGNYVTPTNVTILCKTPDATIYYTTDGTVPTTNSPIYSTPISLTTDKNLKAFGVLAGFNDSPVASAMYHFYAATPILSPTGGIFDAPIAVTVTTATPGSEIRYTTNGTPPTTSSLLYTAPIPLSTDTTLNVCAMRIGFRDSLPVLASYQFVSAQTLTDNVATTGLSGAIGSRQYFKIVVPAGQAKIMFKTSGGTGDCDMYVRFGSPPLLNAWDYRPARLGNAETVTVNVPAPGTWYVMLHGYKAYSGVSLLADYSLPSGTVATPVIKPAGGTYYSPVNVSITCATSGASIRWTSDGSAPTASSPLYTGPIKISTTATVQARAFKSGLYDSLIASATYTIGTSPTTPTVITDGVAVTGLTGAAGSMLFYKITVPAGQTKLDIKTYGGTGDCDLYVRYGSSPTLKNWNYRPARIGNNETVSINAPAAGDWYIMIYGYKSYSGVSLLGDYY